MRIAIAQIDSTVGDLIGNEAAILAAVRRAAAERASLLLLPEMALCGYPAQDLLERDDFVTHSLAVLDRLARACTGIHALVGHVSFNRGATGRRLHNSVSLLGEGRRLATVHKTLLPTYDVFDEARFFEPASHRELLSVGGVRLGVTICEDIWSMYGLPERRPYAIDPLDELLALDPRLIVNVSASPFSLGRIEERRQHLSALARRAGLPLVYCNLVGANDGVIFDGSSLALDASGEIVRQLRSFAEDFAVFELELPEPEAGPRRGRAAAPGEPQAAPAPASGATAAPATPAPAPSRLPCHEEQAYRALCLGISDYLRKTGFSRVVVGLSGGLDSALVATLAADALGPERVLGLSMPSAISSAHSRTDAQALADNLGIELWCVPIAPIVQAYEAQLSPFFAGLLPDVTEENLQARARGNLLMAVSNKLGHLVLTTGNKSELAVGYCTLYGDMAGGLAVLADVPKTLVYRIARWVNRERERIPHSTLVKPPSAELRPGQVDQDSLPPYELLDAVLCAYVEERLPVEQILARGLPLETVRQVVTMIDRQEYKRHQTAPVLRITTRAFGTGRRYPVVQRYDPFGGLDGRFSLQAAAGDAPATAERPAP